MYCVSRQPQDSMELNTNDSSNMNNMNDNMNNNNNNNTHDNDNDSDDHSLLEAFAAEEAADAMDPFPLHSPTSMSRVFDFDYAFATLPFMDDTPLTWTSNSNNNNETATPDVQVSSSSSVTIVSTSSVAASTSTSNPVSAASSVSTMPVVHAQQQQQQYYQQQQQAQQPQYHYHYYQQQQQDFTPPPTTSTTTTHHSFDNAAFYGETLAHLAPAAATTETVTPVAVLSSASPPPSPTTTVITHSESDSANLKPFHEEKWAARYKELQIFHQQHGHAAVPHTYPSNPKLARWVKRQRRQYKMLHGNQPSSMTKDRLQLLNKVSFVWDSHEANWWEKYNALIDYRKSHDTCHVPSTFKDQKMAKLATWVKCQRRQFKLAKSGRQSAMTEDRINLLEKIGFEWEVRK